MKSKKWVPTKHEINIGKIFAKSIREQDDITKIEAANFGLSMAFLFHVGRTGNDHGFLESLKNKHKKKN